MIQSITTNWTLIRALRLILGIFIIIQSVEMHNYWLILPGLIFGGMALFNLGCGSGQCIVPAKKSNLNR